MNKNANSEPNKHVSENSSDKVFLWHTADDIFSFESFVNNGAQSSGKGFGGQSEGFYVWNQKKHAVNHFANFLWKNQESETLLVGVKIDKSDIKYPDWQFDLEGAKGLNSLLFKYQDRIAKIKDLKCKDEQGHEYVIDNIKKHKLASEKACYFIFMQGDNEYTTDIGYGSDRLYLWQAVINRMCKDEDFRDDYNKLLQDSLGCSNPVALKYCGKEALFVNVISYIQKKEQTQPVEHIIYKAEKENGDARGVFDKSQTPKLCEDFLRLKMDIIRIKLANKMGKTADIENGEITPDHKDIAETHVGISRILIKAKRKMNGRL